MDASAFEHFTSELDREVDLLYRLISQVSDEAEEGEVIDGDGEDNGGM